MFYIWDDIMNVTGMALKHLLLVGLVAAAVSVAMAAAAYVGSPSSGGVSFDLLGIRVILYCSRDGNMDGPGTPPFGGMFQSRALFYWWGCGDVDKSHTGIYIFDVMK